MSADIINMWQLFKISSSAVLLMLACQLSRALVYVQLFPKGLSTVIPDNDPTSFTGAAYFGASSSTYWYLVGWMKVTTTSSDPYLLVLLRVNGNLSLELSFKSSNLYLYDTVVTDFGDGRNKWIHFALVSNGSSAFLRASKWSINPVQITINGGALNPSVAQVTAYDSKPPSKVNPIQNEVLDWRLSIYSGLSSSEVDSIVINSMCYGLCNSCNAPTSISCTNCISNASLEFNPGKCICKNSYFEIDASCLQCDITCNTCAGAGPTACKSCKKNAEMKTASPGECTCIPGFYPNNASDNCLLCHSTCSTCYGSKLSNCISCKQDALLINFNTCVCNPSFYFDSTSATCLVCDVTCTLCSGGKTSDCTGCKQNAGLSKTPGACKCSIGYFPKNAADNCAACDPTCLACSAEGSSSCVSCKPFATLTNSSSGSCICISGYYPNDSSANCSQCHSSCAKCSSADAEACTECKPSAVFRNSQPGRCYCIDGFYLTSDSAACEACDTACKTCLGPGNSKCTSCQDNAYSATLGGCRCKSNYFPNPTVAKCTICHETCASCTGPGKSMCMTCKANTVPTPNAPGTCVCSPGSNCTLCDATCSSCIDTSASGCSGCKKLLHLVPTTPGETVGTCICDNGYYWDSNTSLCSACDSKCALCVNSASSCTACKTNYALMANSGDCTCAEGFYWDNDCLPCDITCLKCINSLPSSCTACKQFATLSDKNPGYCSCIAGFYPAPRNNKNSDRVCQCGYGEDVNGVCPPCAKTCKACSGPNENQCILCVGELQLVGTGKCECLEGFFLSENSLKCIKCNSTCLTCFGPSANECLSCPSSRMLSATTCKCGANSYLDFNVCFPCRLNCATCISYDMCTSCQPAISQSNYLSICGCRDHQKLTSQGNVRCVCADEDICGNCQPLCDYCIDDVCFECVANAEINNGKCMCRKGYVSVSQKSCIPCHPSCVTCDGPMFDQCTSCVPPFELLRSGSSPCGCFKDKNSTSALGCFDRVATYWAPATVSGSEDSSLGTGAIVGIALGCFAFVCCATCCLVFLKLVSMEGRKENSNSNRA